MMVGRHVIIGGLAAATVLLLSWLAFASSGRVYETRHIMFSSGGSTTSLKEDEVLFQRWLEMFTASDPMYQLWCKGVLSSMTGSASQFEQDLFIFMNFFKYWPMQGKSGFYVDSGANDAKKLSNSFFFDKCLGWKGLCIEPQAQYHDKIKSTRSCMLIPECISNFRGKVQMIGGDAGASVTNSTLGDVPCDTLESMLVRSGNSGIHVNLWSLDVEGHEMAVLESVNYKSIVIDVLLVEDFWISTRRLDLFLNRNGFLKFHQLPVDALYARRTVELPVLVWYPLHFQEAVEQNEAFRRQNVAKLVC
jgi:hypothetical protein